jgi:hypothetical protein
MKSFGFSLCREQKSSEKIRLFKESTSCGTDCENQGSCQLYQFLAFSSPYC